MVLGFDSADKREIALELIRKLNLTFPCILDSSTAATGVQSGKYRANAVPTTYVIDRAGKIAAAWVGFDPDDPRAKEALAKLGFHK